MRERGSSATMCTAAIQKMRHDPGRRVASADPISSWPRQPVRERGQDHPPDDGPHDRERVASDGDEDEDRQMEHTRQPRADERSEKSEQN